jgi:predicted signal transduction protein with EAL and GGDEF domain
MTHWMPAKLLPSFTLMNATFFCFRMVRTHPFTVTVVSMGAIASTVFIRGEGFVTVVVVVVVVASLLLLLLLLLLDDEAVVERTNNR